MTDKTSGQEFPNISSLGFLKENENVVTLRDYFAAKAMQAVILAASKNDSGVSMANYSNGFTIDRSEIADTAYQYADAMLKERDK